MPARNFPKNQPQPQDNALMTPAAQTQQEDSKDEFELLIEELLEDKEFGPLRFLMSPQKIVALLKKHNVCIRSSKIHMRLLLASMLVVTSNQMLSYGTENGYDTVDISGQYNKLAVLRQLPQMTPQAVEYQIKKDKFAAFMKDLFCHVTARAAKLRLESAKVNQALTLISSLTGRTIEDLVAHDGCYYTVDDHLAKFFPASRTAHKEGSKGAAQIGLQTGFSLKSQLVTYVEITGGNAYEPHYVQLQPNTIALTDAAYGTFAQFYRSEECGAFQVSAGKKNLSGKIIRAYVDGKEVKNIQGKTPKEFLHRYDKRQSVELHIEGTTKTEFDVIVNSKGVATKVLRKVTLRAIRIFDPRKGATWVLTNLPDAVPAEAVLKLMRLRWGIERAFLDLKSHNNLRGARTKSPHLTKSLVWASLISALLKGVTVRCAEMLSDRSLSLRRCHKQALYEQEGPKWTTIVITLACGCALPSASFRDVLNMLGCSKHTGKSNPSSKSKRRTLEHHLDCLIFELVTAVSKGKLLLPYKPLLSST